MANLDHLFAEETKDPAVAVAEETKLDYLFDKKNEDTNLDYLFDTNLDYATRQEDPDQQMEGMLSVFSEDERIALRDEGPIGIGEAFHRQNKWELLPFSPAGIIDAFSVKGSVDRLQANDYGKDWKQKDEDEDKVVDFMRKMAEEQIRGFSWGANVYRVASQMPAFMVEFAASGGMVALGKKITQRAAVGVAKGVAKAGAKRAVRKLARHSVKFGMETALRTPVMYNLYGRKYAENQIFANISLTDKGVEILNAPEESKWMSFVKAYGDAFIEVGSEMMGAKVFKPAGRMIGRPIKKGISKSLDKQTKEGIEQFMRWISSDGKITAAFRKGGFDGIIEEIGEEIVGDQMRAIFGIEDFGAEDGNVLDKMRAAVPGWDDLSVMAGAFSIPGVTSYAGDSLYKKMIRRGKTKQEAQQILDYTSASEKDRMLMDFMREENEWMRVAVDKAMRGEELTEKERYGLNERFYDYLDRGELDIPESQKAGERKEEVNFDKKTAKMFGPTVAAVVEESKEYPGKFKASFTNKEGHAVGSIIKNTFEEAVSAARVKAGIAEPVEGAPAAQPQMTDKEKAQAILERSAIEAYSKEHESFKSNILNVAATQLPAKLSSQQAQGLFRIKNNKFNLSKEEIEYTGILDFLKSKDKFTQEEIVKYINDHKVKIEITFKGVPVERRELDPTEKERLAYLEAENEKAPLGGISDIVEVSSDDFNDSWSELLYLQNVRDNLTTEQLYEKMKEAEMFAHRAKQRGASQAEFNKLFQKGSHFSARAEEHELGSMDRPGRVPSGEETKYGYGNLVLPGGEDYMEILVQLPIKEADLKRNYIKKVEKAEGDGERGYVIKMKDKRKFFYPDATSAEDAVVQFNKDEAEGKIGTGRVTPREQLGGEPEIIENTEENRAIMIERSGLEEHLITTPGYLDSLLIYPSGKVIEKRTNGEYVVYFSNSSYNNPVLFEVEKWLAYEMGEEAGEVVDRRPAPTDIYTHPHWLEKNILFHIRLNFRTDKDGNKVLFLEELQSDWHKDAREMRTKEIKRVAKAEKITFEEARKKVDPEYGYKVEIPEVTAAEIALRKERLADVLNANDNLGFDSTQEAIDAIVAHDDFSDRWEVTNKTDFQQKGDAFRAIIFQAKMEREGVPDAPFKSSWQELGIKQAIKIAIQSGATKVAWINGQQSADRYSLEKYVDFIRYTKKDDGSYNIEFVEKGQRYTRTTEIEDYDDLVANVGEDVAERIKKNEGDMSDDGRDTDIVKLGKVTGVFHRKYSLEKSEYKSGEYKGVAFWRVIADGNPIGGERATFRAESQAKERLKMFIENESWFAKYEGGSTSHGMPDRVSALSYMNRTNFRADNPIKTLTGDDLKVGDGSAHKNFYDKMLPTIVKKYIKKWGSKVEMIEFEGDPEKLRVVNDGDGTFSVVGGTNVITSDLGSEEEAEEYIRERMAADSESDMPEQQMGFEITPQMKIEVEDIGQPLFGTRLAAGVTGESISIPSIVDEAINGKKETPAEETKRSRVDKYKEMFKRITELKLKKEGLAEEKSQLKEALDFYEAERKSWKNKIQRYDEGRMDEEFNALPKYYRAAKGQKLDDAASEAKNDYGSSFTGEGDMEFRDFLIQLEADYQSAKEAVAEVNDAIRQANEKTVITTEIKSLKQRLSDFEAGRKKGKKDLKDLRAEATSAARKLIPKSGIRNFGKILTAIDSIKNEADVAPAIAIIVDNYENYLDRYARAKAVKAILKKYKKPQNILDVKYREKIEKLLETLTAPAEYEISEKLWKERENGISRVIDAIDKDGNTLGWLNYTENKEDGLITITSIDVEDAHQRKGIATSMYRFLESKEQGPIKWDGLSKQGAALKASIDKGQKPKTGRAAQRKALGQMNTDELVATARRVSRMIEAGKITLRQKKEMQQMASEIMRGAGIIAGGGRVDIENVGSAEDLRRVGLGKMKRQALKAKYGPARPLRMIRAIFGKFGERMFYDVVEHAETIAQHLKIGRLTKIDEIIKKHGIGTAELGKSVEIDGVEYQVNNIMTMYAQSGNKEGRAAIIHGNKIKEALYEKFISHLKKNYPGAVAAVDEIKEVVGEKYDDTKRVMADAFNISLADVIDYFPMFRERLDKKADPDADMGSDFISDSGRRSYFASAPKGQTITRKDIADEHQSPISLNFMEDSARAIDNQEHLLQYAGIQKMYNDVSNDADLRNAVIYKHGQEAWDVFDRWMKEAINPRSAYTSLNFVGERFKAARRSLGVFYLGFNVITAMKQFPSAHLALKYTSFQQLYTSMGKVFFNKNLQKKIMELDPSIAHRIVEREIGEIMQGTSKMYRNDFLRQAQMAEQWLGQKSMKMILNMDRWAVMSVFDAVYNSNKATLGHEGAVKLAHKALLETQPQGRRIDLPELYRTNDQVLRMMLMFTNQLNQIYNMMVFDTTTSWSEGRKKEAMVTIASIMLSNLMIYGVSHGGWDWPEDEEEQWRAWLEATIGSMISSVPIAGTLAMSAIKGYDPKLLTAESKIDDIRWGVKKFQNEQYAEAVFDIMVDVAVLSGVNVPYGALKRSIRGIGNLSEGDTYDPRRLIWSKSALYE